MMKPFGVWNLLIQFLDCSIWSQEFLKERTLLLDLLAEAEETEFLLSDKKTVMK